MHSPVEALEKGCMKVEGDKLCRGQIVRTLEREHRTTGENRG